MSTGLWAQTASNEFGRGSNPILRVALVPEPVIVLLFTNPANDGWKVHNGWRQERTHGKRI